MGTVVKSVSKYPPLIVFLWRHVNKLCVLLHFFGFVGFALLAWAPFNDNTYFSENALLSGLVSRESNLQTQTLSLLATLEEEAKSHTGVPHAWLMAQFRQAGLEVYKHNFTLSYPLGAKAKHSGANVYAIMRASLSPSTEALVLSAPYRTKESLHGTTLPGIALMVALAKFFRRHHYWAKDVIFLVTEHELVGLQAWLDAYHAVETSPGVIAGGSLEARAGAIQAAINLEIHASQVKRMDVKVLGLNGQLPNLDLFNLVIDLLQREGIEPTFLDRFDPENMRTFEGWVESLQTLLLMLQHQCTGLPNGAHGLFYRYAIQALTLEGHGEGEGGLRQSMSVVGRVVEGIFRSLNNLLERFHQSYFYYLLTSTKRFVCISYYMPPFALLAGPALLKAGDQYFHIESSGGSLWVALPFWASCAICGVATLGVAPFADAWIKRIFPQLSTQDALFVAAVGVSLVTLIGPFFNRDRSLSSCRAKRCMTLLSFGAIAFCIALLNISMAIVFAAVYVPVTLLAGAPMPRWFRVIHRLLQLVIHPLVLTYVAIFIQSIYLHDFRLDSVPLVALQSLSASKRTLMFCLEDWLLYGNYFFGIVTACVLPIWLMMWSLRNPDVEKHHQSSSPQHQKVD